MRAKITEFVNLTNNRTACVLKTDKGYEADFFEDGKLIETRKLHATTEEYAEDACENWVEKIIQSPN
jgi:hypothetical protein